MLELLTEIEKLSVTEQLELIEAVSRHVRRTVTERPILTRGVLARPGEEPPTDDELREAYTDYLDQKYR